MTRRPTLLTVLFFAFILFVGLEWELGHWLRPFDHAMLDAFARHRAAQLQPDPDIVIVDIDEKSLVQMGELAGNWPWPRSVHGEMVAGLLAQNPAAIVFDLQFSDPDRFRPDSDAFLNASVRNQPSILFPLTRMNPAEDDHGYPLKAYPGQPPFIRTPQGDPNARATLLLPSVLSPDNWRGGLINFLGDKDGVGRRYWLYMPAHGWRLPSLPAALALQQGWPVPSGDSMELSWRGGKRAFKHVSYVDLYRDFNRSKPERPASEFTGKIVIIGTSATGLVDFRPTPISSQYPGVEILATAIDNLKNHRFMSAGPRWLPPLLAIALLLGVWQAFQRGMKPLLSGAALLLASLLLSAGSYLLYTRLLVMPVAAALALAWSFYFLAALYGFVRERLQRERTVQIFNRFLDPRVVKELVNQGQTAAALTGESREITVLFSDIRGFTTLSEQSTPQEIVGLLNRYFTRQVEVIFKHGGTLDKFIGDAIMAFWGAPTDDPRHARNAVAAALEMSQVLEAFRRELGEAGAHFDVGIGIHTGPAVVGFIGSEKRQDYTAIGDTVNLASRIEGETKGRARILVSAATRAQCENAFDFKDFGFYKVKGRAQEVQLFEPRPKEGAQS